MYEHSPEPVQTSVCTTVYGYWSLKASSRNKPQSSGLMLLASLMVNATAVNLVLGLLVAMDACQRLGSNLAGLFKRNPCKRTLGTGHGGSPSGSSTHSSASVHSVKLTSKLVQSGALCESLCSGVITPCCTMTVVNECKGISCPKNLVITAVDFGNIRVKRLTPMIPP